jgi:hydrogenase nickel incorporation protein HypA/HybF
MHELSIAISMIDQILEESTTRGGLTVEIIHLRLGVLSGVDKDALLFSYEVVCEGTSLQGSRLEIESVPLLMYCESCHKSRTPPSLYELYCPDCQTPVQTVVTGREIEVASLEVAV